VVNLNAFFAKVMAAEALILADPLAA